tara:strand:+ start:61 stop:318 length:258 start_codon:yes stop_codon:yes gene_type:complete
MSKKKSYMDSNNILSENLLKKLRDKIANRLAIRHIKKDPKVKKEIDDLNKEFEEMWDEINQIAAKTHPNRKPFKPKKVTIDDIIG